MLQRGLARARLLIACGLLAMFVSLGAFAPAAHASPLPASATHSSTLTAKPAPAHSRTSTIRPYCNGSVTSSPAYQLIFVGQTAALHVNWNCEGGFNVGINVDWQDGNSSYYQCWANCTSGGTDFGHTYWTAGTYYPYVWASGSASGSSQNSTIDVYN